MIMIIIIILLLIMIINIFIHIYICMYYFFGGVARPSLGIHELFLPEPMDGLCSSLQCFDTGRGEDEPPASNVTQMCMHTYKYKCTYKERQMYIHMIHTYTQTYHVQIHIICIPDPYTWLDGDVSSACVGTARNRVTPGSPVKQHLLGMTDFHAVCCGHESWVMLGLI